MATVAAPYGLRPIGIMGSRIFNHGIRKIPIASAYGTSIFFGDVVKLSAGTIVKDTGTSTATPIGVFLGCSYMDSTYGWVNRQYWPASTTPASGAQPSATVGPQAFVCDDPFALFQVQSSGSLAATALGQNAALVQGTGSTVTGNSAVAIGSAATTNTLPVKIIDFVYGPNSAVGDTYTDVIVAWNFGMHLYQTALGT